MTADGYTIGYCTNVHAGVDLPTIRDNLDQFAVPARTNLGFDQTLGVGLWLPAAAAGQLATGSGAADFADFLVERRLRAYTINGFPYDNFHQRVVKHRVYEPAWWDERRLRYTQQLAEILGKLLPESEAVGSISTLPVGWRNNPTGDRDAPSDDQLNQAGRNLRELAESLRGLESKTGRRIVVAIEPEPGCILDTTDDVIAWFDRHLPDTVQRRYLTVCHDICHSAVMMEPQAEVLQRLAAAGIAIGKVQVSCAVVADWESMAAGRQKEALQQLSSFGEDRYLHQTGRRTADANFELAEDLPELLAPVASGADPICGDKKWVVHFHVPIFLERFGHLSTSQSDVRECLRTLSAAAGSHKSAIPFTGHLEIETYAWTVLPESMRKRGLAEDIASEVRWLEKTIVESL